MKENRGKKKLAWWSGGAGIALITVWKLIEFFSDEIKAVAITLADPLIHVVKKILVWNVTDKSDPALKWVYLIYVSILFILALSTIFQGIISLSRKFFPKDSKDAPSETETKYAELVEYFTTLSNELATTLETVESQTPQAKLAVEDFMIRTVKTLAACFNLKDSQYKAMWMVPVRNKNETGLTRKKTYSVIEVGRVGYLTMDDLEIVDTVMKQHDANPLLVDNVENFFPSSGVYYVAVVKNRGPQLRLGLILLITEPNVVTDQTEKAFNAVATNLFWLGHIPQLRKFVIDYVNEEVVRDAESVAESPIENS